MLKSNGVINKQTLVLQPRYPHHAHPCLPMLFLTPEPISCPWEIKLSISEIDDTICQRKEIRGVVELVVT